MGDLIKSIVGVVKKVADFKIGTFAAGKFIVSTAVSFGLSAASKLLNKQPKLGTPKIDDSRAAMVQQAIPPRREFRGEGWTSGPLAWPPSTRRSGTNQEYIHYLILLAAHECEEIGDMRFDGELVPLDGSGNATGKFAGHVTVEKFLGADDQAASTLMQSSFPGVWTSAHQLKGITYAHVRIKWNADLFPNGHPNILFYLKGKKIIDPRLSPVARVYSRNPALHVADKLTETDPDFGLGIPWEEVPEEFVIAAANVCEEQVALNTSPVTYHDRYTLDGDSYSTETPSDILGHMLEAMAGDIACISGAEFRIYAGAWRAPVELPGDEPRLTTADLIGSCTVQGKQSITVLYNGVRGTYIPNDAPEPREFTPYQNAAYLAADDGEERWLEATYRYVSDGIRCQRLSKHKVEVSRRPVVAQIPASVKAWGATPCEILPVNIPLLGTKFTDATFRIEQLSYAFFKGMRGLPFPGCDLALRQTDAAEWDWDETVDEQPEAELATISQPDPLPALISAREQQAVNILNKDSAFDAGVNTLSAEDAGASASIFVAETTFRTANGDVVYDAGEVLALAYSTKYWVYADDPYIGGGAVTYEATTDPSEVTALPGRVSFGFITTPAALGGPTLGDGGGGGGGEFQY